MSGKVFSPAFKITLYKRVLVRDGYAQRYQAASRIVDITPFLTERCAVTVTHDIRQGGGICSIQFGDQPDVRSGGVQDSLYGLIEPMDYLEVRGSQNPWKYASKSLPILFRGFICNISRTTAVGGDGRPERSVHVSAANALKVAQSVQIFLRGDYAAGVQYLSSFRLFSRIKALGFGTEAFGTIMRPTEFMGYCLELANAWLADVRAATDVGVEIVPNILGEFSVGDGVIAPYAMQLFNGTLWSLMSGWADCPWNELFFDDTEDGPRLVYRPSPYFAIDGKTVIMPDAVPVIGATIPDSDIISMDVSRTDAAVANYFWVEAPASSLISTDLINIDLLATGTPFTTDDPNCDPGIYGLRKMEQRTSMLGAENYALGPQQSPQLCADTKAIAKNWLQYRLDQLKALNVDNVMFENGGMTLRGNEDIRAGEYLKIRRGSQLYSYYVTATTHTFVPLTYFKTDVVVERGTGYIQRTKLQTNPAYAEGSPGAYD